MTGFFLPPAHLVENVRPRQRSAPRDSLRVFERLVLVPRLSRRAVQERLTQCAANTVSRLPFAVLHAVERAVQQAVGSEGVLGRQQVMADAVRTDELRLAAVYRRLGNHINARHPERAAVLARPPVLVAVQVRVAAAMTVDIPHAAVALI